MRHKTRRKFFSCGAAVVSMCLAGCTAAGDNSSGSSSSRQRSWEEVLSDRTDVSEDAYQSYSWKVDSPVEIKWEMAVRSGPSVELFIMESREFDEFQAGNRFYTVRGGSGTSDYDSQVLSEGYYRFVIDNTSAGDLSPPTNFDDDVAAVEITVDARPA